MLFTRLSHTSSKCMPELLLLLLRERDYYETRWCRSDCAGALQTVLGCAGTGGLTLGAFQNLCWIAVWCILDLHLLLFISYFLSSCHHLSQSISGFESSCWLYRADSFVTSCQLSLFPSPEQTRIKNESRGHKQTNPAKSSGPLSIILVADRLLCAYLGHFYSTSYLTLSHLKPWCAQTLLPCLAEGFESTCF